MMPVSGWFGPPLKRNALCRAVFFNGWGNCHGFLFLEDGNLTRFGLVGSQRGPFRLCDPDCDLMHWQRREFVTSLVLDAFRFVATGCVVAKATRSWLFEASRPLLI